MLTVDAAHGEIASLLWRLRRLVDKEPRESRFIGVDAGILKASPVMSLQSTIGA